MTNSAQPSGIVSEVGPEHPLDPLTAAQIRQVAAILRRDRGIGGSWRIASIELREPAKDVLAAGEVTGREALAVCWDRTDGQAYRAVVSLTGDAVTSWEHLPGQQPNMTVDEWHECDQMLRGQPALVEALARRGIIGGLPVSRLLPGAGLDDLIVVASTEVNTDDDRAAYADALAEILR